MAHKSAERDAAQVTQDKTRIVHEQVLDGLAALHKQAEDATRDATDRTRFARPTTPCSPREKSTRKPENLGEENADELRSRLPDVLFAE